MAGVSIVLIIALTYGLNKASKEKIVPLPLSLLVWLVGALFLFRLLVVGLAMLFRPPGHG